MIALPIISIAICFAYIIFILFKYGVPVSISETYYILPNKMDWMFSAWCVLTSIPFGFWWYTVTPPGMKWIPIVIVIGVCMIGVSCRYKSGPKKDDDYKPNITMDCPCFDCDEPKVKKSFMDFIRELIAKFNPKELLKYGWARPIHYISAVLVVVLITVYVCIVSPIAVIYVVLSFVMFILIGMVTPGVYNKDYSLDVNDKAWIFFMEIVALLQLFIFVWVTVI